MGLRKMKQERWQQIERIHNSALDLEPGVREEYLERATLASEISTDALTGSRRAPTSATA